MRALLVAAIGLLSLGLAAPAATLSPELPLPAEPQSPPVDPPVEAAPVDAPPVEPAPGVVPPMEGLWPAVTGGGSWSPGDLPVEALPAVAAASGGAAILLLVGFALYSRLSRSDILDHERRDAVYKLIQEEPGISLSDVAQRCGLGWGTTVYHLDRLERAGFVTSEKNGARRSFFPVGTVPRDARAPLATLQAETTRSVATYVIERPGATQGELADALGLTPSAASKQVSKLESAGLVRREREWKTVRLHPEPRLSELLQPGPAAAIGGPATATA